MRVVHISDWHGEYTSLPVADVYVVSGDMLPNFIIAEFSNHKTGESMTWDPIEGMPWPATPWDYVDRVVDHDREGRFQREWINMELAAGGLRRHLGSPGAPVVVCRGNHDFTDLAPAFGGDVWEVGLDPTRTTKIGGLVFGGCRGICPIAGEWSDETPEIDFLERTRGLPDDIDVLVTHAPPHGVLDTCSLHVGSAAIAGYVNRRNLMGTPVKAHLFGHIHEHGGRVLLMGETMFSNAATRYNELEI